MRAKRLPTFTRSHLLTGMISSRRPTIRSCASPTTELGTSSIAEPTTTAAWQLPRLASYQLISTCRKLRSTALADWRWSQTGSHPPPPR